MQYPSIPLLDSQDYQKCSSKSNYINKHYTEIISFTSRSTLLILLVPDRFHWTNIILVKSDKWDAPPVFEYIFT